MFYQENFGGIRPYVAEEMLHWIEDMGEELMLEALKRAVEQNKTTWGYSKSSSDTHPRDKRLFPIGLKNANSREKSSLPLNRKRAWKNKKISTS